jgi:hypothetical protein
MSDYQKLSYKFQINEMLGLEVLLYFILVINYPYPLKEAFGERFCKLIHFISGNMSFINYIISLGRWVNDKSLLKSVNEFVIEFSLNFGHPSRFN